MRRIATTKVTKPKNGRAVSPKGGTSLDVGRRVLSIEARAVQALVQRLDGGFSETVDLLYHCKGKVVVSGMGKSGAQLEHFGHSAIVATCLSRRWAHSRA